MILMLKPILATFLPQLKQKEPNAFIMVSVHLIKGVTLEAIESIETQICIL